MSLGRKLRILHLTTHLNPGGITSYIRLLSRAQLAQGHTVEVISGGGSLIAEFGRDRLPTSVYPLTTKNEFHPKLIRAARAIARKVQSERFNVVHAHTRVSQVVGSMVSAWSGTPMVSTCHGFFKPRWGRKLFPGWGHRVIAISPSVADDLRQTHRVPSDRIRVVLNAIDQEALEKQFSRLNPDEAKRFLSLEGRFPVLASIGRLVEDKGHRFLIGAVARLRTSYPDVFLVLVGEGREHSALVKRIKASGLSKHVSLIGSLTNLTAVYRGCDIFVHPATYREGFGLTIAEAMFAGKPVVATRIPALDRLLKDGENALLVPPSSSEGLARAIEYLLQRPKETERLAEAGSRWSRTVCRAGRFADEVEAVYREVI